MAEVSVAFSFSADDMLTITIGSEAHKIPASRFRDAVSEPDVDLNALLHLVARDAKVAEVDTDDTGAVTTYVASRTWDF